MKIKRIITILVMCLFAISCQQDEKPMDTDADIQAIKDLLSNNAALISAGDLDGWINQFTDDAVFMQPEERIVEGKKAGRESIKPWYDLFDMGASAIIDEVEVHGDWAFARWSCQFEFAPKSGGDMIRRDAKEIWMLKRQSDGSWKCSHIIYNYDAPAPASKEEI